MIYVKSDIKEIALFYLLWVKSKKTGVKIPPPSLKKGVWGDFSWPSGDEKP
jgi:hypothetical protein